MEKLFQTVKKIQQSGVIGNTVDELPTSKSIDKVNR